MKPRAISSLLMMPMSASQVVKIPAENDPREEMRQVRDRLHGFLQPQRAKLVQEEREYNRQRKADQPALNRLIPTVFQITPGSSSSSRNSRKWSSPTHGASPTEWMILNSLKAMITLYIGM